ncbi:MAG: NUDIX hydrolase [Candidatus Aenigmarchaeota archaeon]|nr:NUDIX hydrolase [Candidatus Aenigmarchaeota archaeon]
MFHRKEIQAIVKCENKIILVRYKRGEYWRFVKGGIEKGEQPEDTLSRELLEELNIDDFELLGKLDFRYAYTSYIRGKKVFHDIVAIFVVEIKPEDVKKIRVDDRELGEFKIVDIDEAFDLLKFDGEKNALKEAKEKYWII